MGKGLLPEPSISVGIVHGARLTLHLPCRYVSAEGQSLEGDIVAQLAGSRADVDGQDITDISYRPEKSGAHFTIRNVEIGIGFHWDRREDQSFEGGLRFVVEDGALWAVNEVGVESYLSSVICSEMRATSDPALLRAHAICSRSWLWAQVEARKREKDKEQVANSEDPSVVWHDRREHEQFDVCADDHCQRYQGVTRISNGEVMRAIAQTRGELLVVEGEVCDARFSKCCGGQSEIYPTCWGSAETEINPRYLCSIRDTYCPVSAAPEPPLQTEAGAIKWVTTRPTSFCDTRDAGILTQVLNSYDREGMPDYYRWEVEYTSLELGGIVAEKLGRDLGAIESLEPLERGPSGRICRLRIVGSKAEAEVGKELEIRRCLSRTHLLSSAFVVEKSGERFRLLGAGWGHGVGLCQIGAAVMASRGFGHQSILYHYFRGARIERWWE